MEVTNASWMCTASGICCAASTVAGYAFFTRQEQPKRHARQRLAKCAGVSSGSDCPNPVVTYCGDCRESFCQSCLIPAHARSAEAREHSSFITVGKWGGNQSKLTEELKGAPRVVVRIRDPAERDGSLQPTRPGTARHDWGAICVADPCTINVPSKSKSFVFDAVVSPDEARSAHDLFKVINGQAMIHDALHGYNVTLFTFGQRGAGKTHCMIGGSGRDRRGEIGDQGPGLIDVFITNLFISMEHNDVDCFTVKAQMMELNNDTIYDLFSDPATAPPEGHTPHFDIMKDDKGRVYVPGLQQVSVNKAQQLQQLFHWGLKTKDKRAHAEHRVGRSHLIFTITVENYNHKGDFRRARMTFIDLAGASNTKDSQWINKSHTALGDVISVLSTAAHQQGTSAAELARLGGVPYRSNKLTMLMSDALGGNCKTTMLCCIIPSPSLMEELLTSLIYSYHLKCIQNPITPYDIPADLQKLEEQIRSLQ